MSVNCILQVQCQMKVNIPQSLKEHGESTASARTKLLDEGRKEEMDCIRKHGVFEVVYETECRSS